MALKIGLVGAGSMAQYHIAGYRRAGAEIAAVARPLRRTRPRSGSGAGRGLFSRPDFDAGFREG